MDRFTIMKITNLQQHIKNKMMHLYFQKIVGIDMQKIKQHRKRNTKSHQVLTKNFNRERRFIKVSKINFLHKT